MVMLLTSIQVIGNPIPPQQISHHVFSRYVYDCSTSCRVVVTPAVLDQLGNLHARISMGPDQAQISKASLEKTISCAQAQNENMTFNMSMSKGTESHSWMLVQMGFPSSQSYIRLLIHMTNPKSSCDFDVLNPTIVISGEYGDLPDGKDLRFILRPTDEHRDDGDGEIIIDIV